VLLLLRDLIHFVALTCASHRRLAAENLFLRKQLALYIERKVRPRRLNDGARIALVVLARAIDWRPLLVVVRPDALVQWHRQGFRLFWRWKLPCPGRPRIPVSLQDVIADMARANRTWGEERIAAELLLKLGVAVSPRTVRRYMRRPVSPRPCSSPQTWSTFVRNHARETLACDFFVAVTATFRLVYVFPVLEPQRHRRVRRDGVRRQPAPERVRDSPRAGGRRPAAAIDGPAAGAATAAAGLLVGLAGAALAGRLLQSLLIEIKPTDPATYGAVVCGLSLAALVAIYVPARRASRLDPAEILKSE
jgi:hypothetical protein